MKYVVVTPNSKVTIDADEVKKEGVNTLFLKKDGSLVASFINVSDCYPAGSEA